MVDFACKGCIIMFWVCMNFGLLCCSTNYKASLLALCCYFQCCVTILNRLKYFTCVFVHNITCSNVCYGIHMDIMVGANCSLPIFSMKMGLPIFIWKAQPYISKANAYRHLKTGNLYVYLLVFLVTGIINLIINMSTDH